MLAALKIYADWPGLTLTLRWLKELCLLVIAGSSLIYIKDRIFIQYSMQWSDVRHWLYSKIHSS